MAERGLLMGWKAISDYVGYSDRGLRNYRSILLSRGVVFYRRMRLGKRMVCAWPSDLRAWTKAHPVESSGWQGRGSGAPPAAGGRAHLQP